MGLAGPEDPPPKQIPPATITQAKIEQAIDGIDPKLLVHTRTGDVIEIHLFHQEWFLEKKNNYIPLDCTEEQIIAPIEALEMK